MEPHFSTNAEVIEEAEAVQKKTNDAVLRIRQQTAETEDLGATTLEELRSQRAQLNRIKGEGDHLNAHLDHTNQLQNRFDRWAFDWRGTKRREAKAEAKRQTASESLLRQARRDKNVRERKNNGAGSETVSWPNGNLHQGVSSQGPSLPTNPSPRQRNTRNTAEPLDGEAKEGLERIEKTDVRIDSMLVDVGASLDRLAAMSVQIKEETQFQSAKVGEVEEALDAASSKQAVANARTRRYLTGRWKKR